MRFHYTKAMRGDEGFDLFEYGKWIARILTYEDEVIRLIRLLNTSARK